MIWRVRFNILLCQPVSGSLLIEAFTVQLRCKASKCVSVCYSVPYALHIYIRYITSYILNF